MQLHLQGTPAFMAPEVFDRAFSLPADMWSMGMLAYQGIANRCAEPATRCFLVETPYQDGPLSLTRVSAL